MRLSSRRNPVSGASARAAWALAAVAAIAASTAGARPTGASAIDVMLVAIAVGTCVWAAASAPWWALVVAAMAATALAPNVPLIVIGLVALAVPAVIGLQRRNWAWARSASAGLGAQVLIRLQLNSFFGLSSIVAIAALGLVLVVGVARRPERVRKVVQRVVLGAGLLAVVAAVGVALGVLSARSTLRTGNASARLGLNMLSVGDLPGAQAAFADAQRDFTSAAASLDRVWTQPARLLPVLAQNRNAATTLAQAAASAAESIGMIIDRLDLDALKLSDGRIDLDAVRALEQPLTDLSAVLDDLHAASSDAESPWLLGVVQTSLDDLNRDLDKQTVLAEHALRAVRLAPQTLGANGKRVYFVAFCTPAEARGSLGFMGNFAEVTADNGRLEMTRFGRTTKELEPLGGGYVRRITGLDEFLKNYGRFGFNSATGGTAAQDVWLNVTISRDFPTTAQVIAQLYPQTDGQPIDGVFALDPAALAALLQFTGPIAVDGAAEPLTSANAEQFLLIDQYRNASYSDRVDTLEELAKSATSKLLAGPLPAPNVLGKVFGQLARDKHLLAWSSDPAEEAIFTQFHADGALPDLHGGDGIGIAFNNGAGDKIDNFLHASLTYDWRRASPSGAVESSATLKLTNSAPTGGLPFYVIGSVIGLPTGTNRTYVTLYSALDMTSATLDGVPIQMTAGREKSWNTYSAFVDLSAGQTRALVVTLKSEHPVSSSAPVVVAPALVHPADITVTSEP